MITCSRHVDPLRTGPLNRPALLMAARSRAYSPIATPILGGASCAVLNTPKGRFCSEKSLSGATSTKLCIDSTRALYTIYFWVLGDYAKETNESRKE